MSEVQVITAELRKHLGTAVTKKERKEHLIPCVLYQDKKTPIHFKVEGKIITKLYQQGFFYTKPIIISIEAKKQKVLPKQVQLDPVSEQVIHVDFLPLEKGKVIDILVPVVVTNTQLCEAIKRGGVLNTVSKFVAIRCDVEHIPVKFEVDVKDFKIGFSFHASDLKLTEKSVTVRHPKDTLVTITGKGKEEVEEVLEEESKEENK